MEERNLFDADHEDAMLVKGVIRGDRNAFKEMIHKYEKLVNSIVYKMIGQVQEREDICQETFLRVYKNLPYFKFQSKLSTWIASIAFNLAANYLKKKKIVLQDDLEYQITSEEDNYTYQESKDSSFLPDEILLNKEKLHLLLRAVEELKPVEKTLIQLFHQEELSLVEIFSITAIPVNTIKSHLFRARKKLKEEMFRLLNQ